MPPNLRKPQPNLSKPSEGESFNAERKPTSEPTNPLRSSLNLTAERELGTVGGIKSTARLTVGVDNLIGQQGIDIEIDATNRTVGFGAGIGSTKGKLGVNIGGKIGYDEEGKISIKGAEAGINIGGFGGSASIDEDEGIRGSISVAGAKVEIGISKDGKKNVSLCYGVPGGELCVTFEPDPGIETPTLTPSPTLPTTPTIATNFSCSGGGKIELVFSSIPADRGTLTLEESQKEQFDFFVGTTRNPGARYNEQQMLDPQGSDVISADNILGKDKWQTRDASPQYKSYQWLGQRGDNDPYAEFLTQGTWYINGQPNREKSTGIRFVFTFDQKIYYNPDYDEPRFWFVGTPYKHAISVTGSPSPPKCPDGSNPIPVPITSPAPTPSPPSKIQLPNYPQHFKPMDCCDKVEEIYKYLGIAKLKKNKFPVSNAFLVPGGSGNDNCFDYYAIAQALFRMLANGLIINPKSKPLGSEWQNANATAWASAIYEMMAESMSDGNSTQRFEVAAIMQLTQMMATLAENGRKIEFVADAIGIEPLPVAENVPVCFTVYEGHKGFGKKEPKKINVSGLKTDDDVEKVLGKMLNPSLIPITAWKFRPGQISINEALRNG